jgi:hypothetical protein
VCRAYVFTVETLAIRLWSVLWSPFSLFPPPLFLYLFLFLYLQTHLPLMASSIILARLRTTVLLMTAIVIEGNCIYDMPPYEPGTALS